MSDTPVYKRIVLAYDGSREGRAALKEGAELADACRAEVHLLAVVSPAAGVAFAESVEPSGLLDDEERHLRAVLEEGLERLRHRGLVAQGSLRWGDPTAEILAVARAVRADLIVLGHRAEAGLTRWWRGSVGEDILRDTPCSVLVAVHPGDSGLAESVADGD